MNRIACLLTATLLLSPVAATAQSISFSRCNSAGNPATPGLQVILPGDFKVFVPVGYYGLTPQIVHSERLSIRWLREVVRLPDNYTLVGYKAAFCGGPIMPEYMMTPPPPPQPPRQCQEQECEG